MHILIPLLLLILGEQNGHAKLPQVLRTMRHAYVHSHCLGSCALMAVRMPIKSGSRQTLFVQGGGHREAIDAGLPCMT